MLPTKYDCNPTLAWVFNQINDGRRYRGGPGDRGGHHDHGGHDDRHGRRGRGGSGLRGTKHRDPNGLH